VGRIFSGSSLTKRKFVCSGGSSMSLSNLLAHSAFIFSGIQTIMALRPPKVDLSASFRCIWAASAA
jgi:hypothetical protein